MNRIAVMASGKGSTFDHLCRTLGNQVVHLTVNRSDAGAMKWAIIHGVPVHICEKRLTQTEKWSEQIYAEIERVNADLIVLAGFDQKIFVPERWMGRILNTHPSLLPKYGGQGMMGLNVHRAVLQNREIETGCTVHLVDNEYDHGKILEQRIIKVQEGDTPENDKVYKRSEKTKTQENQGKCYLPCLCPACSP